MLLWLSHNSHSVAIDVNSEVCSNNNSTTRQEPSAPTTEAVCPLTTIVHPFSNSTLLGATISFSPKIDDISKLPPCTIQALSDALAVHDVLVFRGIGFTMSMEQHLTFTERFGPVHLNVSGPPAYMENYIHMSYKTEGLKHNLNQPRDMQASMLDARVDQLRRGEPSCIFKLVTNPEDAIAFGQGWHQDLTFLEAPPMIGCLLMRHPSPPGTGNTMVSSLVGLYHALPSDLKKAIANRVAMHTDDDGRSSVHPVVRKLENGQPALFVNRHMTRYLIPANDAMPGFNSPAKADVEADAKILERLFDHLISYGDSNSMSISWEMGDLILFDQTSTMHRGSFNYGGHRRELHRIFVSGEKTEMYSLPSV